MVKLTDIETPRLKIETFSKKYLTERYVSWLNDPEIMRYSEQKHKVHTLESCREYWKSFEETPNYFWAIVEREKMLGHIGNLSVHLDKINLVADIGILIGEKSAWGKGYGLEAWNAVCHYLLRKEGMHKVSAGALLENKAMLKVMERSGMVKDGFRRKHYLFEGKRVDIAYAALFSKDILQRPY